MVYFVQGLEGGAVKIGTTEDLAVRLPQLEAKYKRPLAVLATMSGGRNEEQAVHARFAHLRFGRTEQFKPAADLMAFIGRPLLVGANPDATEAMPSKQCVVTIKRSPEWKDWLEEGAKHCRVSAAALIDRATARYAKEMGFTVPPPQR